MREGFDDRVEQIAGTGAVQGRNRDRLAETELVELVRRIATLDVVSFVRNENGRLVGAPEQIGDLVIAGGQPRFGIDHEDDDIGLANCAARLIASAARDLSDGRGFDLFFVLQTACVDQR